MKLEFEQVEENYDDTTHLRTITEQAVVPKRGVLLRTTVYSPHHLATSTVFLPGQGNPTEGFEPLSG
jgi:hypothetical protein